MEENKSFVEKLEDFASKLSDELMKKYQEEALDAYEGFLWRTKGYLTEKNREYKQASLNGLIKDLKRMVKIGQELAMVGQSDYWLLKTDSNLGQQMKYCEEWMDKLGVEHKSFEEYVKNPLG